mgnify:FL=1
MKIEMLRSAPGSADGIRHIFYMKGKLYDMQTEKEILLARTFINIGYAIEGKMVSPTYENKAVVKETLTTETDIKSGRRIPAREVD